MQDTTPVNPEQPLAPVAPPISEAIEPPQPANDGTEEIREQLESALPAAGQLSDEQAPVEATPQIPEPFEMPSAPAVQDIQRFAAQDSAPETSGDVAKPDAPTNLEPPAEAVTSTEQKIDPLDTPDFIEYIQKWAETNNYDKELLAQDRQLRDMASFIDSSQIQINSQMAGVVSEADAEIKAHKQQILSINQGFLKDQKARFEKRYNMLKDAQHEVIAEVPTQAQLEEQAAPMPQPREVDSATAGIRLPVESVPAVEEIQPASPQ